jgi:hypothetical protein
MRNSDELVLGEVFRDGDEKGWTSVDLADCEAWPFSDRESAAQSLEQWHHQAMRRLAESANSLTPFPALERNGLDPMAIAQAFAEIVAEPEMVDGFQLTQDDNERAQEMAHFLIESFGAGLGPVFSCVEAEAIVCLGRSCGVDLDLIERFKRCHVADDEPGDVHETGWPAEQPYGAEDSEESS